MTKEELILKGQQGLLNLPDPHYLIVGYINVAKSNDLNRIYAALKDVAEQAYDKPSEATAIRMFGQQTVDAAKALYPELKNHHLCETSIKGGKGDEMTTQDIADEFDVPVSQINRQLKMGIKVEKEHTKDASLARDIAMDHLSEMPDYYTRLEKMEKTAKQKWGKKEIKESFRRYLNKL